MAQTVRWQKQLWYICIVSVILDSRYPSTCYSENFELPVFGGLDKKYYLKYASFTLHIRLLSLFHLDKFDNKLLYQNLPALVTFNLQDRNVLIGKLIKIEIQQ
jgi:hypothetical protein